MEHSQRAVHGGTAAVVYEFQGGGTVSSCWRADFSSSVDILFLFLCRQQVCLLNCLVDK